MRRIREIESGSLRALSYLGAFLLVSTFVAIPLIFLNSNLLWGEANQYGRVPIPGHKVIHLPAGEIEVTVAAALPGRGNETPELLLPPLTLTMKARGGQEAPTVAEDIGSSVNANDSEVDTQRTAWKLQVPEEGDYLAVLKGDFTGYGVNAQAWFGREPNPLHGWQVILAAMAITLLGYAVWLLFGALRKRRRGPGPPDDPYQEHLTADQVRIEKNLEGDREGAM
ncbi:MAG TPA: hypothetical protein VHZ54_03620 [Solirubrobacterales bacterium]|jgi:hypothetical protein|nr:hypothetical protein [Solirubrobacterales bacterium]